ncbi:MAG: hypothetical protein OES13_08930 [Acidimicrobiia bacterium]|nr:hypothetical protein [Acidimicrobiia bacterium]
MAHVHFKLSDGLVADAKEAGLSIARITEEAIREALTGSRQEPVETKVYEGRAIDDTDRYREGYALGVRGVTTQATTEELAEIAALRSARWHDFGIDTAHHTLGLILLEAGESADTSGKVWLSRGPFAEGLIDSAVEARPVG